MQRTRRWPFRNGGSGQHPSTAWLILGLMTPVQPAGPAPMPATADAVRVDADNASRPPLPGHTPAGGWPARPRADAVSWPGVGYRRRTELTSRTAPRAA